jgi:hypothetical protein
MATFDSDALKPVSQFIPDSISLVTAIAAGATGVLATITPASNKRAALLFMSTLGTTNQSGISVVIGGTTVIPVGTLVGESDGIGSAGRFKIGLSSGSSSIGMLVAKQKGAVIQIVKNAGNTTEQINYVSAVGD